MLKKIIGENIRYYRKKRGLTQKMAAQRADFTPAYWGYLERGEKNPSVDVIAKIAGSLGIQPYFLMMDSSPENLAHEFRQLLHTVDNMGENHIEFILIVIRAYIKTHLKNV